MIDARAADEIATKLLLSTCQVRPQPSKYAVHAVLHGSLTARAHLKDNREADFIPLTTGSVAELYIEPMLPCFGDVDVMFYPNTRIAIPEGQIPPVNLPDQFHNRVHVAEIINSHLPGYVYLKVQYLLIKRGDYQKNRDVYRIKSYALPGISSDKFEIHGPALTLTSKVAKVPSTDFVPCTRCLVWPPIAAEWPIRRRNYGWPDSPTVDYVVSNGCDVVCVTHRQCRHDQWMSKYQHRLSFSRAEIVLVNSWTPVQQIVYHLLRVYAKTERLTDNANNPETQSLSNYHIKTLMLWACEKKPTNWWTDDLCVVRICTQLMHTLAVWLTDAQCPHYFINHCNLIDNSLDLEMIARQLMSVDYALLSAWFLNNYVRKCAELCSSNISLLFRDASTGIKLQNAVSVIVDRRLNNALSDRWVIFLRAEGTISGNLPTLVSVRSCAYTATELAKTDARLCLYFTAVAFLHVALKISRNDLNEKLMHVLTTVIGQSAGIRPYSIHTNSVLSFREAANLMKVVANKSLSTLESIGIELSKAYLHRALRCESNVSDSDSIYCLANVYLVVLYYTTAQYKTAIDYCTQVTSHSQCNSHVVQGELLPKIDDDIDRVLGLAVLYQYLQTTALKQQQRKQVGVFTTELFAHYMHIKCLSAIKCRHSVQMFSTDLILRYRKYITDTHQLVVGDALLLKLRKKFNHVPVEHECQQSTTNQTSQNAPELVELLHRCAVEHLTTYRQLLGRDFGSVVTMVTTDFQTLYAYKNGDYQQCLQLCKEHVGELFRAVDEVFILIFPSLMQLLDDDMVSLISLIRIANPKSVHDYHSSSITQLSLLLYLMTQSQLKLRHSVTSLSTTLINVKVARRRYPVEWIFDQLTLKFIERRVFQYFELLQEATS